GQIDIHGLRVGAGEIVHRDLVGAFLGVEVDRFDAMVVHRHATRGAGEENAIAIGRDVHGFAGAVAVEQHRVGTGFAFDDVAGFARVPDERVVARAHAGHIIAGAADEEVVARAAGDGVVARAGVDLQLVEPGICTLDVHFGREARNDRLRPDAGRDDGVRTRGAGHADRVKLTVARAAGAGQIDIHGLHVGAGEIVHRDLVGALFGVEVDRLY